MKDRIISMPIEDVLDLHTFQPKEVFNLLEDYFEACIQNGIFSVRIIHGKGRGILRQRVRSILERHPMVEWYGDAALDSGGWGATRVKLKSRI
ncbi:Smr/MutS family protein [Desulfococcus sp.]|uniref:Smr/MutS family protein n=1 Tax=Desulfococcus sp. TaxID=2025834 RepID=UPI003D109FF3